MDVHCGEIKRGEIYWVDFGKTKGSEQGGKRPALVVQNNIGNKHSPTTKSWQSHQKGSPIFLLMSFWKKMR